MNWFIVHSSTFIVIKSHLGSFDVATDANANVAETFSFDAWGNRRNPNNWGQKDTNTSFLFSRGYTGHEHYDLFRVINMNGRLYDPVIGRFFSPDPFVGDPMSTQDFNRYSYVRNNPLMYTDPTGYQYSFSWSWSSTGQLCVQLPTVEIVAYRHWWNNPIWGYGYFAPVYGGPYYESYEDYLYWQNNIAGGSGRGGGGGGGGNGSGSTSSATNNSNTTTAKTVGKVAEAVDVVTTVTSQVLTSTQVGSSIGYMVAGSSTFVFIANMLKPVSAIAGFVSTGADIFRSSQGDKSWEETGLNAAVTLGSGLAYGWWGLWIQGNYLLGKKYMGLIQKDPDRAPVIPHGAKRKTK